MSLSIFQVLQLMIGQSEECCSNCSKSFGLVKNAFPSNSTFWFVEAVMYICLISISLSLQSWMVFSLGLVITFSIEVLMLQIKPIEIIGEKDRIDKVI